MLVSSGNWHDQVRFLKCDWKERKRELITSGGKGKTSGVLKRKVTGEVGENGERRAWRVTSCTGGRDGGSIARRQTRLTTYIIIKQWKKIHLGAVSANRCVLLTETKY